MADVGPIWYVGPISPIDVPLARLGNIETGQPVSVEDPDIRASLLLQDIWTDVDPGTSPGLAADAVPADVPADVSASPIGE
jgi:hypothetical protein